VAGDDMDRLVGNFRLAVIGVVKQLSQTSELFRHKEGLDEEDVIFLNKIKSNALDYLEWQTVLYELSRILSTLSGNDPY
jgi:hypothetical protein